MNALAFHPVDTYAVRRFAFTLPRDDPGHGDVWRFTWVAQRSRDSAALFDRDCPIALLGVSHEGRAWMHTLPRFRCPLEAFRMIRQKFREWARDGDVECAMDVEAGRPVRVMGLIAPISVRDGIASWKIEGTA